MAKKKQPEIPDEYKSGDGPQLGQPSIESFNLYAGTSHEEKVDFALCCICAGSATRVVVRELVRLCGMNKAAAERICNDALKHLAMGFEHPKRILRFQSAAWYQMQLTDPDCPIDLKFKARQAIDTLLGLRDPVKPSEDDDDDDDESKKRVAREKKEIAAILPTLSNEELIAIADVHSRIKTRLELPNSDDPTPPPTIPASVENKIPAEIPNSRRELF